MAVNTNKGRASSSQHYENILKDITNQIHMKTQRQYQATNAQSVSSVALDAMTKAESVTNVEQCGRCAEAVAHSVETSLLHTVLRLDYCTQC